MTEIALFGFAYKKQIKYIDSDKNLPPFQPYTCTLEQPTFTNSLLI